PTYEADYTPGSMTIRPGLRELLNAWKGEGPIPTGAEQDQKEPGVDVYWKFPPVFLKAEVENGGVAAAQVTAAYLGIADSVTDPTPYLEMGRDSADCEDVATYNSTLLLNNYGWGRVNGLRMTYSFGFDNKRIGAGTFEGGNFDSSKKVSMAERL